MAIHRRAPNFPQDLRDDRYVYYFQSEKDIVYELDDKGALSQFYKVIRKPIEKALTDNSFATLLAVCRVSHHYGVTFLRMHERSRWPDKARVSSLLDFRA